MATLDSPADLDRATDAEVDPDTQKAGPELGRLSFGLLKPRGSFHPSEQGRSRIRNWSTRWSAFPAAAHEKNPDRTSFARWGHRSHRLLTRLE